MWFVLICFTVPTTANGMLHAIFSLCVSNHPSTNCPVPPSCELYHTTPVLCYMGTPLCKLSLLQHIRDELDNQHLVLEAVVHAVPEIMILQFIYNLVNVRV
jgi:hypothetical protein